MDVVEIAEKAKKSSFNSIQFSVSLSLLLPETDVINIVLQR